VVPDSDSPDELMAAIDQLQSQTNRQLQALVVAQMQGQQPDMQVLSQLRELQTAVVDAGDRLLATAAAADLLVRAAEAKIAALQVLAQLGVADAQSQREEFLTSLGQDERPSLAQLQRRFAFTDALNEFANTGEGDVAALLADFRVLFDEADKDQLSFRIGEDVAKVFEDGGNFAEADQVREMLVEAFADSDDPNLRAKSAEFRLRQQLSAVRQGEEGGEAAVLATFDSILAGPLSGQMLQTALQTAHQLDAGNADITKDVFAKISEAFADYPDTAIADLARRSFERHEKRSSIVGQPFVVEGVQPDGTAFDWSKYQGKVVLVDFWATWCMPCLQQMPRIHDIYDRYRDRGFEVVGVNVDHDTQRLQQFLSLQPIPWTTVVSADATPLSGIEDHPFLAQFGIDALPFLVLVDRTGTAVALNLRDQELENKLDELLNAAGS
jgi:thiol-disulfide isomerase/thioredoxin